MKKLFFTRFMMLTLMSLVLFSCGEDEDDAPQVLTPKLEGLYVFGTNTIASEAVDPNARMVRAVLNPAKSGGANDKEGIYGQFMYIGANSTIQFTEVENEVGTTYGALGGGTVADGIDVGNTDIADELIHGTLEEGAPAIRVSEEGLYYVFVNTNDMTFRMMKVEAQMLGDAQAGQWSTGTVLPMIHASTDSVVFEKTGVPLTGATGYKYRFNNGYEIFNDNATMATLTFLGVESYGTAWDTGINDLIYKDENIPHKETGVFTVRLKYDAATRKWTETKIRDYSTTSVGLFGNAYMLPSGAEGAWDQAYGLHTPTKNGNVYTWMWDNVQLIEGREFVILENGEWGGLSVVFNDAITREGEAFTSNKIVKSAESENFMVATGGTYDISLAIDVNTGERTLTAVSVQ